MKHEITVEKIKSKIWRNALSGRPASPVRWRCSCSKIGPEYATQWDDRARRGGQRHTAAVKRKAAP